LKIAVLAWGSLIWDPRGLSISTDFAPTGPSLPLEFSRISGDGRLTLVLDDTQGVRCRTYVATSACSELEEAIDDLRVREGMPSAQNVGFIVRLTGACSPAATRRHPESVTAIADWSRTSAFDAVVWTALGIKFRDAARVRFSVNNAIDYLATLKGDKRSKAFEYIRRAQHEIQTPVRAAFLERWPAI
jgi:hypothetical protein